MRTLLVIAALAVIVSPAGADYYVAGDFNGWNASGNVLTDLGGGIWQASMNMGAGRHEFKITIGDWSQNWPGSGNSWTYTDGDGNVTVTFDSNAPVAIGVDVDPGAWTAVGDWQGWNNADAATAMAAQGGGIYKYQQSLAPGWYQWKAVNTGSWDAIGADSRSINADTQWFEVTAANPTAIFTLDALNGRIGVEVVPEPSSLLALVGGLLGLGGLLRRR